MSVLHLQQNNFQETIANADKPVLVDFWATWCGPCQMLGPVIEQIAEKMDGEAIIAKVNVDEEKALAASFRVMSIPTLIVFKDGQEKERMVGFVPEQQVMDFIKKYE